MTKSNAADNIERAQRNGRQSDDVKCKRQIIQDYLEAFMRDLCFDAECGRVAAEYNLEKVGIIKMVQGFVAGEMGERDNWWDDLRWELTNLSMRTSMAEARKIILRDPPLEIALWDAMFEARDIAESCGGCEPNDPWLLAHRAILAHLLDRVERIRAAERI
jgi:hypothetical protein